jgi:CMP-N,N'-diacetyllegionaminic acid synthase
MISGRQKTLAIIPARGGSIGVPGKNVKILGNKPLIRHSIDFALEFDGFCCVVVTTDSNEIIQKSLGTSARKLFDNLLEGEHCNFENRIIIHKRKQIQAETLSRIIDTLQEIALTGINEIDFDWICLLQPTSPFRTQEELEILFSLAEEHRDWTSIFSVAEVGGIHPERMLRLVEGQLSHFVESTHKRNAPRQELERLYIKDGAYYLFRRELLKKGEMFGTQMIPFVRNGLRTINIDTPMDFEIAELLVSKTNKKNKVAKFDQS